jgi:hypothetical protein
MADGQGEAARGMNGHTQLEYIKLSLKNDCFRSYTPKIQEIDYEY